MAEGKLTFLTEVELPPYCFLSEAVEWVAFGRVPQMQELFDHSTEEPVDYRFYWREMPDNFQAGFHYPWFEQSEFESLGVPVNEEYFKAAEKCAVEPVDTLPKQIAEYEAKEPSFIDDDDGTTFDLWKKLASDLRDKLHELGPLKALVDSVEAGFRPHQEIACAKLFQLLVTGEIKTQAINEARFERLSDEEEYEASARFDDVPPSAYSLDCDWLSNEIVVEGSKHVALRLETADLLKHRKFLLQAGKAVSVQRFGAFYVSGDAGRSSLAKSRRGRRAVVDWSLMRSHLRFLASSNKLPDGKENCIYELIAHAESELGKSPGRTSVQRNMAEELNALYAQS